MGEPMDTSKPPKGEKQPNKGAEPVLPPPHDSLTPANDAGENVSEGPYVPVDCKAWPKFAYWSATEAGCITCGFEPLPLQQADFEEAATNPDAFRKVIRRIELFDREIQAGTLIDMIAPIQALKFLDAMEEDYPPDLKKTAERFRPYGTILDLGAQMADLGKAAHSIGHSSDASSELKQDSQSGQTKVIQTLERMLLAVSKEYLKFDPDRAQNPTAKLIQKAMGRCWKQVPHLDTIRTRLNAAVENHWEGPLDE